MQGEIEKMEKIKKYIPKIILLDTMLYTLIIVTLYFILSSFKLMFREWIYIVSTIIIMFGFIVRIIQLLLKIKKKCKDYSNKHIYYVIFTINSNNLFFWSIWLYT